jgi:hypothetical protein
MSDYLNNLAARTLNLAPVVQPRPASLFEPAVPRRGIRRSLEQTPEYEDLSASNSPLQTLPLNPLQAQRIQPPLQATIDRDEKESDPKREPVEGLEIRTWSSEPAGRRATVSPPAPVAARIAIPSAPPESNAARIRSLTLQAPGTQTNSATLSGRETNTRESRQQIEPKVGRAVVDQSLAAQPLQSSANSAKRPDNLPIIQTRSVIAQPAARMEQPQTVSVTIGRVDVRAIFSPPPAPRSSRAQQPAPMSLDEYLKQRSEGRR